MSRQTTATMLIGQNNEGRFPGNHLHGRHLLTLTVGSRAAWSVHELPRGDDRPALPMHFVAHSPDELLAQGLLAFLAAVIPDALSQVSDTERLLTTEAGGRRVTLAPSPTQAEQIAAVFADYAQAGLTRYDDQSISDEQVALVRKAGVLLLVADATDVGAGA